MNTGEINNAIRRALNLFDSVNFGDRLVKAHIGYYYELQALVGDAVHFGAQAGTRDRRPLEDEPADMVKSSMEYRAKDRFCRWNKATGFFDPNCVPFETFERVMVDATAIGYQAATGLWKRVPGEHRSRRYCPPLDCSR